MLRISLIVLNTIAGLVMAWFLFREVLPRATTPYLSNGSLWVWGAIFGVGLIVAFLNVAYIGQTTPRPIAAWERFKKAWKAAKG